MVKYLKTFTPLCLVDKSRKKAFQEDILAKKYIDSNSLYKCKYQKDYETFYPVKDALNQIYRNKCAYCETQINRTSTNIEHYRPKSIYYALAYGWSNLLPICDMCNSKKSNHFEIESGTARVKYNQESLEDLQYITAKYNKEEQPKFLHPEIDNYEHLFRFNSKGKIIVYKSIPNSDKMIYTINHSDLNHHNLLKRRAKILQDFIKMNNDLFDYYKMALETKNRSNFIKFQKNIQIEIKIFFNDENEFIAVRKFIIERLRFYLMSKDKIFVKFFKGYLHKYIKNIEVYNN